MPSSKQSRRSVQPSVFGQLQKWGREGYSLQRSAKPGAVNDLRGLEAEINVRLVAGQGSWSHNPRRSALCSLGKSRLPQKWSAGLCKARGLTGFPRVGQFPSQAVRQNWQLDRPAATYVTHQIARKASQAARQPARQRCGLASGMLRPGDHVQAHILTARTGVGCSGMWCLRMCLL